MNLKKLFLYVFIASVGASALIGIGVLLFGSFGDLEARVLMTTFSITLTSILGLACGAYYESGKGRLLPAAGIFFAAASALLNIYLIWAGDGGVSAVWKSTATAGLLATATAHLSLISLASLDRRFLWSRFTLYGCVSALSLILLYILWFEPESSGDLVSRVLGILGILVGSLTVLTPVLHKLSRRDVADEIDAEIATLRKRIDELELRKSGLTGG
jgi:hypothetical protein